MEKKPRQLKMTEDFDIIPVLKVLDDMGFRVERYDTGTLANRNDKVCVNITVTKKY